MIWALAPINVTSFSSALHRRHELLLLLGSRRFWWRPERALYRAQSRIWKSSFDQLHLQFVGMMKEGGREIVEIPGFVAVLSGFQILLHDPDKIGIADQSAADTVERRGEARDCYRQQNASGAQHPPRFANRFEALVKIGQVVQRPEKEHSICCPVVTGNGTGISHLKGSRHTRAHCGSLFCLLDMQRNQIDEIDYVAPFRQGKSIRTCGAADVQNECRRGWQKAIQKVQSPHFFPAREWALQPFGLLTGFVVPENLLFQ